MWKALSCDLFNSLSGDGLWFSIDPEHGNTQGSYGYLAHIKCTLLANMVLILLLTTYPTSAFYILGHGQT